MKVCRGVESIDYVIRKDVDFIAYIISPWHLLGVQAVVHKIRLNDSHAKGIIFLCRNHCNEYLIREIPKMQDVEFVCYESDKLDMSFMSDFFKELVQRKTIYKNRRYFIIPYKLDVFLFALYSQKNRENCSTECYVIDEGIGSYLGINIDESEDIKCVLDARKLALSAKKKMNDLLRLSLEFKLKKQSLFHDFSLLIRAKNNRLCINKSVVDYYRHAISHDIIDQQKNNNIYDNVILINTQPMEGVGDGADIEILYDFCKRCCEKGMRVLVKPHPAERDLKKYTSLEQYVSWDMRSGLSQETILNSLEKKPMAIISFNSTTLITGKIFWNIPSFSLAKILLSRNVSDCLKKELRCFINMFSEHTIFCDSIESIVDMLLKNYEK